MTREYIARYMNHRDGIANCQGQTPLAADVSTHWWRPKLGGGDMVACEGCYYLYFAASFMEDDWEPVQADIVAASGVSTWVCDMSLLPMKVAHIKAMQVKNSQVFWDAARTITNSPPCPLDEEYGGAWHGLAPRGKHGGTCSQCFAGMIVPFGFENHFIQLSLPADLKMTCIFNTKTLRFSQTMDKFDEAISSRDFSRWQDYAIYPPTIPLCAGSDMVKDRKWYGSDAFLTCESCWHEFVKHTSLAHSLPDHTGVVLPTGRCHLYSPRMRGLWADACTRSDMTEFIKFARHHAAVYEQTLL